MKKYTLNLKQKAPAYLSIDFWSKQSASLTDNKLYVIRSGTGRFIIFSEKRFRRPYLDLRPSNAEEFKAAEVNSVDNLKRAFRDHYQENANLEQLHLTNIYQQLVERVCGSTEFYIGPRGNRSSSFKIYLKDSAGVIAEFPYSGQEELDYTLWTEDSVLLFEAKQFQTIYGLDIGWHKLAYPAVRFKDYQNLKIIPIYYLRIKDTIYLFVFRKFQFFQDGVMLNDMTQFTPVQVFRVDLNPGSRITRFA